MTPLVPLRTALSDPALLAGALPGDSWALWRALLIAAMGESLTNDERAVFTRFTGREHEPLQRVEEFWVIAGRRGGKTRAAAVLATYIAALCKHPNLVPGERGLVLFLAQNQKQAAVAFRYTKALFESQPMLAGLVNSQTADTLSLNNGIDLEVRPASYRSIRGLTCVAVVADEICFWRTDGESKNPDAEVLAAVRPALATTGGPLICITSPYAKRGEAYATYREHFGPDGDPLIMVAQGASRDFNPSLPERVVQRAMDRDMASARSEYFAEWRTDIADFVTREAVAGCVDVGVCERPPNPSVSYRAFVDPSGGAHDSMCLAIAHSAGDNVIIDALREIPSPFHPETAVDEFVTVLRNYRVGKVVGDRYSGQWCATAFERRGIRYDACNRSKSDLYRDLLPRLNSGTVRLLDNERAVNQVCGLERRTARGGRDSIDHGPGAHDDLANVIAGAAVQFDKPAGHVGSYRQKWVNGRMHLIPWAQIPPGWEWAAECNPKFKHVGN